MSTVRRWRVAPPDLASANEAVEAFKAVFERLFEDIAVELPAFERETASLLAELELFRALGDSRTRGSVGEAVAAIDEAFEALAREAAAGEIAAARLAPAAGGLARTLGEICTASERLRLISLNALIVATRTGEDGAGFASITRALIDLSKTASARAGDALALATGLRGEAEELLAREEKANRGSDGLRAGIAALRQAVLQATEDDLAALDAPRAALEVEAGNVRELTTAVMQRVQEQDILRQGLDHVLLALNELAVHHRSTFAPDADARATAHYLEAQRQIAELSTRLVDDIVEDTQELVTRVHEPLALLRRGAGALASALTATAPTQRTSTATHELVTRLDEALCELDHVGAFTEVSDRIGQLVAQARPMVAVLEALPGQLRVLESLLRIEVAHVASLSEASTIVAEIVEVRTRLARLADANELELEALAAELRTARARAAAGVQARTAHAEVRARVATHVSRITGELESRRASVASLLATTHRLEERAGAFGARLGALQAPAVAREAVASTCATLARRAATTLEELPPEAAPPGDCPDEWLASLVSRFTLVSHKLIAADLGDLSVDAGDEAGAITLF